MIEKTLSGEMLLFFQNYLSFYKEFLQMETNKYNDIEENRYDSLQNHIKEEEVFMLRSKGMELERDKLMAKTDFPKATFRELIPQFDSPEREKIEYVYQELSQVLLDIKEINRRCNNLTQIRLHHIHTQLDKLSDQPHIQSYTAKAHNGGGLTGILSKKI